jgi:PAS domain S-box-containing protein
LVGRAAVVVAVVAAAMLAVLGAVAYAAVREDLPDAARHALAVRLLLAGAALEVGAVALGIAAARRLARPLGELAAFARSIDSIDAAPASPGVPAGASAEVGLLAHSFADMLLRLRGAAAAERARRDAQYRAVFEGVGEGLITLGRDGVVQTANRAALRMFGCDASEMIGRRFRLHRAGQPADGERGFVASFLKTGEANMVGKSRKLVGRRKDGSEIPIELSITETPVQGRNLITGVLRDISERRQAEKALRLAQSATKKLALVASRTQNIVVIMDAAGRIEWVNDAFTRISEYATEEAVGKTLGGILRGPGSDRAEIGEIDEAVAAGQGFRTEIVSRSKSGNRRWVEIDVQPVGDKSGRLTNFIAVGSDITARKAAEDELRTARDRAEVASRAKSEFLSTVSHELRTPLTSISGALGLLRAGVAGDLPPKMKSMLDIAASNCARLMQIINDILDVQKIEAGKMDYRMGRVDLAELVRESIEANRTYGRDNGVSLVAGELVADAVVRGDADRLMQVMANLISNAIKFSPPKGEVEIAVTRRAAGFRITVADHGAGIPEDFRAKVFQKFWQADSSDTRRQGGTGLGLAISKAIVEHHAGSIGFESEVGRGTRFHVDLPAAAEPADRQPPADPPARDRSVAP